MSSKNLAELKTNVAVLGPRDRKQLLDHLVLLEHEHTTSTRKDSRDLDMWVDALIDAISSVLGPMGIPTPVPVVLKRLCTSCHHYIEVFMLESGLQKLRVPQKVAVYSLLADLLVRHAKKVAAKLRAPISIKFVVSCSNAVPGLFEDAFPGYIAAGLASVVATGIRNHRN